MSIGQVSPRFGGSVVGASRPSRSTPTISSGVNGFSVGRSPRTVLTRSAKSTPAVVSGLRPAELDDLTRLAASIFDTPMSAVALIDRDRQWFAGKTGLADDETPRDI